MNSFIKKECLRSIVSQFTVPFQYIQRIPSSRVVMCGFFVLFVDLVCDLSPFIVSRCIVLVQHVFICQCLQSALFHHFFFIISSFLNRCGPYQMKSTLNLHSNHGIRSICTNSFYYLVTSMYSYIKTKIKTGKKAKKGTNQLTVFHLCGFLLLIQLLEIEWPCNRRGACYT